MIKSRGYIVGFFDRVAAGVDLKCNGNDKYEVNGKLAFHHPAAAGIHNECDLLLSLLADANAYEIMFELQRFNRIVASYFHHMPIRRPVYNPSEKRAENIINYIDIGCSLQRCIEKEAGVPKTNMVIAAQWQANRSYVIRARVDRNGLDAQLAWKFWSQPALTLSANSHWDFPTKYNPGI